MPARPSLCCLYDRVSVGGVVIIDEDYSSRQTASLSEEACDAIANGLRAEARPAEYRRPFVAATRRRCPASRPCLRSARCRR